MNLIFEESFQDINTKGGLDISKTTFGTEFAKRYIDKYAEHALTSFPNYFCL